MTALLALSDVLVVRALERAYSRGLDGSHRAALGNQVLRHRAYEHTPIPAIRHGHALEGAWTITVELTQSWDLPIRAEEWSTALDAYCRELLTARRPRSLDGLEAALAALRVGQRG